MPMQVSKATGYSLLYDLPSEEHAGSAKMVGYSLLDQLQTETSNNVSKLVAYSILDTTHSVVVGKATAYTLLDTQVEQDTVAPIYCIIT